jgi:hypothetical protein
MQNYTEQALAFIQKFPNSNKNTIGDFLQLRGLPLFNLLKGMVKEGQIVANLSGLETTYMVADASLESKVEPIVPAMNETKAETGLVVGEKERVVETLDIKGEVIADPPAQTKTQTPALAAKKQAGRNMGTFLFNGVTYNKSKLVHAVVNHYCSTHKGVTHDKLKEVFPDKLMKRFGIFQTVAKGREISGAKYDRYLFKEDLQIKLTDYVICTCNQITSENLLPFVAVAREQLGYTIE